MTQQVTMPDGSIHQFPDEATPEQMQSALLGNGAEVQPNTRWDSVKQGFMDPINGLAQLGLHAMNGEGLGNLDPAKSLDTNLTSQENAYQAAREAAGRDGIDWSRMAGNMISTAPLAAVVPETKLAGIWGLLGDTGINAASGAGFSALQPVTGADNFSDAKTNQMELGAGMGAAMTPITRGLSYLIKPSVSKDVETLMNEGVTPTPGQILGGGFARTEDKLTSIPGLGDIIKSGQRRALNQFNTAALGRAMNTVGEDAPETIGRQGMQAVKKEFQDQYENLLPKLKFHADAQFADDMMGLQNLATSLPSQQREQFNNIVKTQITDRLSQSNMMSGHVFKGMEENLGKEAKGYLKDSSFDNRKLGEALKQALAISRQTLQRTNPQYANDLGNINRGYANYAILRKAASSTGAENGVFTPAQLQSAVRSADNSVGKGNFATGTSLMQDLSDAGKNVLSQKYPDSGTFGREALGYLLGAGLEGGGIAAGHAVLPIAAGALTALPYTPWGQKVAAQLLAGNRPAIAGPLAQIVKKSTPALANAYGVSFAQGSE